MVYRMVVVTTIAICALLAAFSPVSGAEWCDNVEVSGYFQFRGGYYPDADDDENSSEFRIRRSRMKVEGKPVENLEVQLYFASGEGDNTKIKKAFIQKSLNDEGTTWFQAGRVEVPFAFDTPQSSSRRLPLERNMLSRRQIPGEMETGVTIYHTCPEDQELFDYAKHNRLWGTGDAGNIAVGIYNGQGKDYVDHDDTGQHLLLRLCKPT